MTNKVLNKIIVTYGYGERIHDCDIIFSIYNARTANQKEYMFIISIVFSLFVFLQQALQTRSQPLASQNEAVRIVLVMVCMISRTSIVLTLVTVSRNAVGLININNRAQTRLNKKRKRFMHGNNFSVNLLLKKMKYLLL